MTQIIIPYRPRQHFLQLHNSGRRHKFIVAHRRAGKTVALVNEMIRAALRNPRRDPHPRYAYIGPSFRQTKDLAWSYLKNFTAPFRGMPGYKVAEGELKVTLPTGATVTLYGGDRSWESLRGLYLDGAVLDEYAMLNPSMLSDVIRPAVADYKGFICASGTSNGDDHFHELKKRVASDPAWDTFVIPVTETDALDPEELREMTRDMTPEAYAREMLCSFSAPVEGAYYGDLINRAETEGRICAVPHDPTAPVFVIFDLGIDDATAVWFVQRCGREIHAIDHDEFTGMGLEAILRRVFGHDPDYDDRRAYNIAGLAFPHDIKARELGTGMSRFEVVSQLVPHVPLHVVPFLSVEDGIQAVRSILPVVWFDKDFTEGGIAALRNYRRNKNGKPEHDWASHSADSFRYFAVVSQILFGYGSQTATSTPAGGGRHGSSGPLRRKIRGVI